MAVYLISYDLKFPLRDYQKIEAAIKSLGSVIKPLQTVWLVDSALTSNQIRDKLSNATDTNDKILVVPVSFGAASKNLVPSDWNWIQSHLKQ